MPLILFCGYPGAGKTTRALTLAAYLENQHNKRVVVINEENLSIEKNDGYANGTKEKMTRAFLRSNVEKELDNETIVILDSLNYIKGYRYELYCLVRNAQTTHCVVYCETPQELAITRNQERDSNGFTEDLCQSLINRMETPNQKNRWDKPLFILRPDEETPCEDIFEALINGKKPRDPISTKPERTYEVNYLYELDKACQEIIEVVISEQNNHNVGDSMTFIGAKLTLRLTRFLTVAELKRIKTQFLKISKMHPPDPSVGMKNSFLDYLNTTIAE
mmetsp:Transcript_35831/g.40738  ORF Transcript_35831/g.40738 Transcript_35831/m.40738 type:complete len:276 (-) Transcript_35831:1155-1982(-)